LHAQGGGTDEVSFFVFLDDAGDEVGGFVGGELGGEVGVPSLVEEVRHRGVL
jgi:hypothetical protein